jgi:hypothetical protein
MLIDMLIGLLVDMLVDMQIGTRMHSDILGFNGGRWDDGMVVTIAPTNPHVCMWQYRSPLHIPPI